MGGWGWEGVSPRKEDVWEDVREAVWEDVHVADARFVLQLP